MFSNADLEFEDAVDKDVKTSINTRNFIKYLESDDRELRQSAYNNLYKAYGAYNNTLGSTLAGKLRRMSLMLEHITIKQLVSVR